MVSGMEPNSANEVAKLHWLRDIVCVINEIQNIKLELSVAFDGLRFKDPCYIF
jgi:hypothetical protein